MAEAGVELWAFRAEGRGSTNRAIDAPNQREPGRERESRDIRSTSDGKVASRRYPVLPGALEIPAPGLSGLASLATSQSQGEAIKLQKLLKARALSALVRVVWQPLRE